MEIYAMTPREFWACFYGIVKDRIEQKRNLRNVVYGYHVHSVEQKNRLEVWDLWPIEGDPTPKQRAKEAAKRNRADAKRLAIETEKAKAVFRKRGWID
jgi:hypothetical protein